jgi:hypothetical protein
MRQKDFFIGCTMVLVVLLTLMTALDALETADVASNIQKIVLAK